MNWSGTRRRLLALGGAGIAVSAVRVMGARAGTPLLSRVSVDNGGRPFAGDSELVATLGVVSAPVVARVRFRLARRSLVTLDVLETGQGVASEKPAAAVGQTALAERRVTLEPGEHELAWTPDPSLPARTYILRLAAEPHSGALRPASARAVVRILGVDAGFGERSVRPGDTATLVVRSDAKSLVLQMLQSGPELQPTYANGLIQGIPVGAAATIDWQAYRDQPGAIPVQVGADWPSGVYAAQVVAGDGRVGFAPLVIRPATPQHRVAVVMPTTTWQAYNFYDTDGDGWGDTWYAHWKTDTVDLTRPHAGRGVPYRYRSYDLGFQHWLAQTKKQVDTYADEDLEQFATPDALRAAYDLIVFPGHTEYVTTRLYDLVQGYRDRGGNLMFLAANNFFRRVDRQSQRVRLVKEWRDLGRPESALLGVQYVASDRGQRHAPFTVAGADVAPWAFAGTGLANGAQFGLYGIEIDARSPESPPGVQVLATITDLFGPGRSAEMTYYEHASGAKVFSAGVLNFGGQVLLWPATAQLLENLWQRLA
jgi:hypothetical protein